MSNDMQDTPGASPALPRVVRVPRGIRSKQTLLRVLADKLQFPGYFGENWDALEECLSDLSWLPPGPIAIVHVDLPFGARSENRTIYMDILRDAVARHAGGSRAVKIVWPTETEDEISRGAGERR